MFNRRSILVASLISLAASTLTGCAANTDESSDEAAAEMSSSIGMDFIRVDEVSDAPPDGSDEVTSTPLPEQEEGEAALESQGLDWSCLVDYSKPLGGCWTCINHKGYYGTIYNSGFCGQVCVVPGWASSTGPC